MERPDATALRRYDFGTAALNEAAYGRPTPPAYDLAGFANRVAAFYGTGDRLVPEANARSTLALLSNAEETAFPISTEDDGAAVSDNSQRRAIMTAIAEMSEIRKLFDPPAD